ncbi:mannan endo-1,6-alpha-mannosidase [Lophium mytilinum]|uniref:Mannan endo-1,6-alpha-mannosidase n=1 Tax=Lophium mytilinum TaxID=390894 RepID=A0A6A6R6S1_9PEZI|nr:mannan endo-1,6-alpha-mannosidase [Lophium mytilinum]
MFRFFSPRNIFLTLSIFLLHSFVLGLDLDVNDPGSIKQVAKTVADELLTKWYHGTERGQIVGILPDPYYWWEAGGMWGTLIEYAYYTGDTDYNKIIADAMLAQVGPNLDYMPPNQTKSEGNDDQAFWAFAALTAAELKFPDPPPQQPQWLALAQAVFNQQTGNRWDTDNCGGGLRWQIYNFNKGWTYKNLISNGGLFLMSARLARFTKDQNYVFWANKVYDWLETTGIYVAYHAYDGSDISKECKDADHHEWSYNNGVMLAGSAYVSNLPTGDSLWHDRVHGLLNVTLSHFFPTEPQFGNGTIMSEYDCEVMNIKDPKNLPCNNDQRSFKAYATRWLAVTTQLVPDTRDLILPKLRTTAQAAAEQCSGAPTGSTCSQYWFAPKFDGTNGPGEQMSALSVISGLLIKWDSTLPPVSTDDGGTSKGNPDAGKGNTDEKKINANNGPITISDKAGAWFLTAFFALAFSLLGLWLCNDKTDTGWSML